MATPGSGSLSLFLAGEPAAPASGALPLFTQGGSPLGTGLYHTTPLYLEATSGNVVRAGMDLFLAGYPWAPWSAHLVAFVRGGTRPFSATLPLVLGNNNHAASSGVPLYVAGTGVLGAASGSMNLFLARWPGGSLPLYVSGPTTPLSGSCPLFAWGRGSLSSGVPLAVPDVLGTGARGLSLMTRGF